MRRTYGTPRGTKDYNLDEAERKAQVETAIRRLFHHWGYQEVVTSTLEYARSDGSGEGGGTAFRFFDRDGDLLALRSDLTAPIARMAASRLKDLPRPLRLFYTANVFRYEETGVGRDREFYQAGIELIGAGGPEADAEVVALAVKSLQAAGLERFRVDVGHMGFFNGMLEECGLREGEKQLVREAALHKDFVTLNQFLRDSDLAAECREKIASLVRLRGGKEVFAKAGALAGPKAAPALEHLQRVWDILEGYGLDGYLEADLGMVKDFAYYTGLLLEGYSPELGFSLCTGGRYDLLIAQSGGAPAPAVGFAVGIERLLQALPLAKTAPDLIVLVDRTGNPSLRWETAEMLRELGLAVAVDLGNASSETPSDKAAWVVTLEGEPGHVRCRCQSLLDGGKKTLPHGDLEAFFRTWLRGANGHE